MGLAGIVRDRVGNPFRRLMVLLRPHHAGYERGREYKYDDDNDFLGHGVAEFTPASLAARGGSWQDLARRSPRPEIGYHRPGSTRWRTEAT